MFSGIYALNPKIKLDPQSNYNCSSKFRQISQKNKELTRIIVGLHCCTNFIGLANANKLAFQILLSRTWKCVAVKIFHAYWKIYLKCTLSILGARIYLCCYQTWHQCQEFASATPGSTVLSLISLLIHRTSWDLW